MFKNETFGVTISDNEFKNGRRDTEVCVFEPTHDALKRRHSGLGRAWGGGEIGKAVQMTDIFRRRSVGGGRRPRYALRYAGYLVQRGVTVPLIVTLVCGFFLAATLTVSLGLLTFCFLVWSVGQFTALHLIMAACLVLACGVAVAGCCGLYHLADYALVQPPGHFLNPLPPENAANLPDSSVLVRASAPDRDWQRNVLLRASVKSVEDAPELLLRPVSCDTTE